MIFNFLYNVLRTIMEHRMLTFWKIKKNSQCGRNTVIFTFHIFSLQSIYFDKTADDT